MYFLQSPDRHALLDLKMDAIDKLHAIEIYPIIIFMRYKNSKAIK